MQNIKLRLWFTVTVLLIFLALCNILFYFMFVFPFLSKEQVFIWEWSFRSICKWTAGFERCCWQVVKRRIRFCVPMKRTGKYSFIVCVPMYVSVCRRLPAGIQHVWEIFPALSDCSPRTWYSSSGRRKHNYEIMGLSAVLLSMYKCYGPEEDLDFSPRRKQSTAVLIWSEKISNWLLV